MKRSNGFTLIEILVVLAVIAILVSIATINTNHDGRYDDLKNESQRLKFIFSSLSDEALFQNKNIGLLMSRTEIKPYFYEITLNNSKAQTANNSSANQIEYHWAEYTGKNTKLYTLPEKMEFELTIDGQSIELPFALKESKEEVNPNIFLLASGEQSQFSLNLLMNDFDAYSKVRSDGLGRFFSELIREEE